MIMIILKLKFIFMINYILGIPLSFDQSDLALKIP